jgi:hypothetical protein
MLSIAMAVLLQIHGLIHILGFLVYCRIHDVEGLPYKTTLFFDKIRLGDSGIFLFGIAWLLAAMSFVVVGIAFFFHPHWWKSAAIVVTLFSFIITLLGSPQAKVGVVINILIVLYLLLIVP